MGEAFNPDVDVIFNQTTEQDVIRTLQTPFDADRSSCFVLARVENPATACRLSYIVVGRTPDAVEGFLADKTALGIAQGPLKHALEDVGNVFELAKAGRHLKEANGPEALKRPELRALDTLIPRGCCSNSSGVSVLVVNKPAGASEYRQVLLTNKHIRCIINDKTGVFEQLTILDAEAADQDAKYGPCE